jgi:hypothetical protein
LKLGRDLGRRSGFSDRLIRDRIREIVDVDENPPAAPPQGIDELVARNRKQPWRERGARVPSMPL